MLSHVYLQNVYAAVLQELSDIHYPISQLSFLLPPRAIVMANAKVQNTNQRPPKDKKRGHYKKYDAKLRIKIGKYACVNGIAAASSFFFSRKLDRRVSTSTVLLMKQYLHRKKKAACIKQHY